MNLDRLPPKWTLAAALLILAPALDATTLLTNGSPLYFERPPAVNRTLVHQEQGFTIVVPPEAEMLVVEWETTPNLPVELMVRHGLDVGLHPTFPRTTRGEQRTDQFTMPNPRGVARIEVKPDVWPYLKPGIYYIGFITRADVDFWGGVMTASFGGGTVDNLYPVAESTFDSDAEGWTHNSTASGLPGTNVGSPSARLRHSAERGNPGGFLRLDHNVSGIDDYFVAPEKFLVDLYNTPDARIEFDLARVVGDRSHNHLTEIKVIGENTSWKWFGPDPPAVPTGFEFFSQSVQMNWQTQSAPVRRDHWVKSAGQGTFEEAFSNPQRIEIRASYVTGVGGAGIDNVKILARGDVPDRPVVPTISSFSGGFDDWRRNDRPDRDIAQTPVGASDSRLLWSLFGGNPDGHIRIVEDRENRNPQPDAFVAPFAFLGDYTALDQPRFEFDFQMDAFLEATDPVRIRIYGVSGTAYEWTGARPTNLWGHQVAPIRADAWTLVSGADAFEDVIAHVVRIEVSAQHSPDRERSALDNFQIATADSPLPPQIMTVSPAELSFSGEQGGESPEPQPVQVTASGGPLEWSAQAMGPMADKIGLSTEGGLAPGELDVSIDTSGLTPGQHSFDVMFQAVGTTLAPRMLRGTLSLSPQLNPTPRLSPGGIGNAASMEPRLSAGGLGVIYGADLGGPPTGITTAYGGQRGDQLPSEVNGVRVLFYETYDEMIGEGAILYLSDTQLNFQAPIEIRGRSAVRIVVANGTARSEPYTIEVTQSSPGIFTWDAGRAVAINYDGSLNTPSKAAPRSKLLTIFVTGQGATAPEWETGRAASAFPLIHAANVQVFIGGVEAKIQFAGLTPGAVGVLQINAEPGFLTPLGEQPVTVVINGFSSRAANVTIR